jgi:hypothetical protein
VFSAHRNADEEDANDWTPHDSTSTSDNGQPNSDLEDMEQEFEVAPDIQVDRNADSSPTPLQGAQISQEMGVLLLLSLTVRHNLTYSALADIMKVICTHFPPDADPTPYKSIYRLLKSMHAIGQHITTSRIVHRLCGKCGVHLPDSQPCQNSGCQMLGIQVDDSFFLELPIDAQLKAFFQSQCT